MTALRIRLLVRVLLPIHCPCRSLLHRDCGLLDRHRGLLTGRINYLGRGKIFIPIFRAILIVRSGLLLLALCLLLLALCLLLLALCLLLLILLLRG